MPFDEVFTAHRKVRRIKIQEFVPLGFSRPYISAIERQGLLPEKDKLDILVSFMGAVAVEQGSDAVLEQQELLGAWWESQLDRLGVNPDNIPALAERILLDPERQETLVRAMNRYGKS
jgi:hypothetical protein